MIRTHATAVAYQFATTSSPVIVVGDLDVDPDQTVRVVTSGGGIGDWTEPNRTLDVRREQLGHVHRVGRDSRALITARLAMSSLADRMSPNHGPRLRVADPVAYWDARESMDTLRAALCLAAGVIVPRSSKRLGGEGSPSSS